MTSKTFDINLKELERVEANGYQFSSLKLHMYGRDINNVFINTLRRVMMTNIPTYAFASECMIFDENTTVFNNDQLRVDFMNLPFPKTELELDYLDEEYWRNVKYDDKLREKHKLEKNIEIYINVINNTNSFKYVTTNDIKYYEDNEEQSKKYDEKYPLLLVRLRPSDTIKCRLKAVLGTGERHAIWFGASNSFFIESNDGYDITIESMGQFTEYELLWKACRYFQKKMNVMKDKLYNQFESKEKKLEKVENIELFFDGETYTSCYILTDVLQDMPEVKYAGVGKMNELVEQILVKIEYNEPTLQPLNTVYNAIDIIINKMKYLELIVYDVGKKYIKKY